MMNVNQNLIKLIHFRLSLKHNAFVKAMKSDSTKKTEIYLKKQASRYFKSDSFALKMEEKSFFKKLKELKENRKIDVRDYRLILNKNRDLYPTWLKVFDQLEELVGYYGYKKTNLKKTYSAICFGTFFRDVPYLKHLGLINKMLLKSYYSLYCEDWTKHLAKTMALKNQKNL
jgi:hypothetical protein